MLNPRHELQRGCPALPAAEPADPLRRSWRRVFLGVRLLDGVKEAFAADWTGPYADPPLANLDRPERIFAEGCIPPVWLDGPRSRKDSTTDDHDPYASESMRGPFPGADAEDLRGIE
jgi:hypothetical protein